MAQGRKTAAQRQQESYIAGRRAWEDFHQRLSAVESFHEALALVAEPIPSNAPGRKYYSNLGFFLHTFAVPDGANATELSEYLRLIGRFDKRGELKEGARQLVEERLRNALAHRKPQ